MDIGAFPTVVQALMLASFLFGLLTGCALAAGTIAFYMKGKVGADTDTIQIAGKANATLSAAADTATIHGVTVGMKAKTAITRMGLTTPAVMLIVGAKGASKKRLKNVASSASKSSNADSRPKKKRRNTTTASKTTCGTNRKR